MAAASHVSFLPYPRFLRPAQGKFFYRFRPRKVSPGSMPSLAIFL